jgi:predicted amidohydrolase YtcJ
MSPAIEGPYTVILGRHTRHHDTQDMPYSYLIEEDGHSSLVPAVALRSYGTVRDTEKWKSRDKRHIKRDNINFEEYNPYLTGKMLRGVDILTRLAEEDSEAKTYNYNRTVIKAPLLQRGIKLYNSAIAASIGMMLQAGDFSRASAESCGEWVDIAGQYLPHAHLEKILTEAAKSDTTLEEIKQMFDTIMSQYADMAAAYACNLLGNLTGRTPTTQDIEDAISASRNIHARLRETTEDDRMRDIGSDMMIGYGYDFREREEQIADFRNTR